MGGKIENTLKNWLIKLWKESTCGRIDCYLLEGCVYILIAHVLQWVPMYMLWVVYVETWVVSFAS